MVNTRSERLLVNLWPFITGVDFEEEGNQSALRKSERRFGDCVSSSSSLKYMLELILRK